MQGFVIFVSQNVTQLLSQNVHVVKKTFVKEILIIDIITT